MTTTAPPPLKTFKEWRNECNQSIERLIVSEEKGFTPSKKSKRKKKMSYKSLRDIKLQRLKDTGEWPGLE